MNAKQYISVALVTFITCVLTLWIYASSSVGNLPVISGLCDKGRDKLTFIPLNNHSPGDIKAYIKQRNNISRLLNLKQKINAQNECEVGGYVVVRT